MKISSSVIAAAAISGVSAHSIMQQIVIGGVTHGIGEGIRVPSYNGPITDVTTGDIACNGGPNPTKSSPIVHNVAAGSTVQTIWRHSANNVIDSSHKGPVMAYMKKVNNAASDSGVGGGWFKISEDGYSGGSWGVDRLIAANGLQSITIPSCIPPGQYLLRGELIALHSAGQRGQAQFYMECAQINVTGGGSASPATVSLPGAYSASDPGILFNLYTPNIQYTIPGPRPFTCGGGGNPQPTTPPPQQTTPPPQQTTTPPPQQTTPPPTTGGSPLYGQCGGNGWTGPTSCSAGTCKATNEWYSQCLP